MNYPFYGFSQHYNLEGKQFGRLTVKRRLDKKRWVCSCVCGKETIVAGKNLWFENTKSCGCLQTENRIKHGMDRTKEYRAWERMLQRCYNPNHVSYKDYGGRGILVCEQWRKYFIIFFNDMGIRPKGYSLERKDVNGNYTPDNCTWIPLKEQARNTRRSRWLTVGSKRMLLIDWARKLKRNQATLLYHLDRKGKSMFEVVRYFQKKGGVK